MFLYYWAIVALVAALSIVGFARTFNAGWRARSARHFARRVGLDLPNALAESMGGRLARRGRAVATGSLAGAAVGVTVVQVQGAANQYTSIWLLLGLVFMGMGVAVAISALTERQIEFAGKRVARSDAVGVADYVSPIERVSARIVVAVSVLGMAAVLFLPLAELSGEIQPTTAALLIVALGVVSLMIFEVGSHRIVARGRQTGSTTGLAWEDALRSASVRDLLTAPICLGLWGTFATIIAAMEAIPEGRPVMLIVLLIALASAIAVAIVIGVRHPQRYYLRRLWPELSGGAR